MNFEAIQDLLFRMADDDLITGHRMSEWTGIGPILEEDIAFSSMAQDEVGHAQAYYMILDELLGQSTPDQLAFGRKSNDFRCAQLVEYPIGDYAYSLVRHALYDIAEAVRLESLCRASFMPLSELAKKLSREEKYHQLHAETWIRQLGPATEESNRRLQEAFDNAFPVAYSLFEPTSFNEALKEDGLMDLESELEAEWEKRVRKLFTESGLKMPVVADKTAHYGGRTGKHTAHLAPLLGEMDEVFAIDPAAKW